MPTEYEMDQALREQEERLDEMNERERLAVILEGYANSLRNNWIPFEGVLGNLLIILTSEGYLKLEKEYYVKEVKDEKS